MTRDQILEAAASIFSQKGYHATSMNDIARAVNLQKASLYHHVDSKQEILLSLLDEALDLLIGRFKTVLEQPNFAVDKLRAAMAAYLNILAENRELAAILLFEHRSLDTDLRKQHIPRRDRFEQLWRDILISGVEAGEFNCDDPALAARALLGLLNWVLTWYQSDGKLNATEIADQYADYFLHGILHPEQR